MRKYGVIGDPINHSLSPLLHGEIYSQTEWGKPQQDEWGNTYYPYANQR